MKKAVRTQLTLESTLSQIVILDWIPKIFCLENWVYWVYSVHKKWMTMKTKQFVTTLPLSRSSRGCPCCPPLPRSLCHCRGQSRDSGCCCHPPPWSRWRCSCWSWSCSWSPAPWRSGDITRISAAAALGWTSSGRDWRKWDEMYLLKI